jgi:aspartate/methionine/tyrosine aminotransferase
LADVALETPNERFSTVLLGVLTAGSGALWLDFASGGHPGPVILRHDGTVDVVELTGSVLGVLPNAMMDRRRIALEPGDEVVLVEPFYDLYPFAVVAAGGVPRYLTTSFPDFRLDLDRLAELVTDRTRVIVVNTPTNPTGQLLRADEIRVLGELAERHDAYLLADEAYEHVVLDGLQHRPVAADPVCAPRTVTVSSVSKTFSATGWRIGWAIAPPELSAAVRAVHQFVTFTASAPLQRAAGVMLRSAAGGDYYQRLAADYAERRDVLLKDLQATDLEIGRPEGTYFLMTRCEGDDVAYVQELIAERGVAAIPASVFFADPARGRGLVRFAFCKRLETLRSAGERLARTATP